MATRYYPAIIERGISGYGVIFPDLPGCTSAGDTIEDAAFSSQEAASLHVGGLLEDGEDLPNPTPLDNIARDSEIDEVARILVRVDLPGRAVRFNATMDEALLARIDSTARSMGMSRSGFLADAARRMME
ncbi:antitoxin HicB [Gammaproteobacteria bacterium]